MSDTATRPAPPTDAAPVDPASSVLTIAVHEPPGQPLSITGYATAIRRELAGDRVVFAPFTGATPLPAADVYWDPTVSGGNAPTDALRHAPGPVVLTVHGAAPMAVPARDYFPTMLDAMRGLVHNATNRQRWRRIAGHYAAVIAVSNYAKGELVRCLGIAPELITPIHHAADPESFRPAPAADGVAPYLLHVSQYQPKKNLDRVLAAYDRLATPRPRLVVVAPGFPERRVPNGVEVVRNALDHGALAGLYAGAIAFVFPSLHETFGMPIVEAMASGCPVITARDTACGEVGGDAAMRVDPRSIDEIAAAMRRLVDDDACRARLADAGLERARSFSWSESAARHLAVFERVVGR